MFDAIVRHLEAIVHHQEKVERRIMTKLDELHAAEGNVAAKIDAVLVALASANNLAQHPVVVAAAATDADLQAVIDKLNADSAKVDAAMAPPAPVVELAPATEPAAPVA